MLEKDGKTKFNHSGTERKQTHKKYVQNNPILDTLDTRERNTYKALFLGRPCLVSLTSSVSRYPQNRGLICSYFRFNHS